MRESPALKLACRLMEEGLSIKVFDPDVVFSELIGENLRLYLRELPGGAEMMFDDAGSFVEGIEALVVTKSTRDFTKILSELSSDVPIIDLVGIKALPAQNEHIDGIGW